MKIGDLVRVDSGSYAAETGVVVRETRMQVHVKLDGQRRIVKLAGYRIKPISAEEEGSD